MDLVSSFASPGRPPATTASPAGAAAFAACAGELQLERALALLQEAGLDALPGAPRSPAWMQGLVDALVDLSSRDPLTGLANRRAFDAALAREIDRIARSGDTTLLLVVDIDHFKRVNDTWGHAVGDHVIRSVAGALAQSVRPMDLVARIGGEEFAVILPTCPPAFAQTVAERIRSAVQRHPVVLDGCPGGLGVTVSVGGAFGPSWVRTHAEIWMQRADAQLYRAKSEGRDRVCLEPVALPSVSAEEKGLLFAPVTAPAPMQAWQE